MILVILAVCILLAIIGCIAANNTGDEGWLFLSVPSGMATAAALIATLVLAVNVSDLAQIDDRIAMYEEENTIIETQIADIVSEYQKYETGIIAEVKPESAVTMVTLYPELKSDKLVESQIEVYVSNNEKIKALKDEKIRGRATRWWLYFGK